MTTTAVSFNRVFNKIQTNIPICIKQENLNLMKEVFDFKISEGVKCCVEAAVRDYVIRKLSTKTDLKDIQLVVKMCIEGARQDLCLPSLPVLVLSDALDCLTLTKCEEMFEFIESKVSVFNEELFFTHCKNQVLRMCNDVLRRLSRSQNTIFCGRILLFLARFFPFSERSGLNLISEFNLENFTVFTDSATTEMDGVEGEDLIEDASAKHPSLNYTLYTKFWSLQDFFRNPTQCFQKAPWNLFTKYADDIFEAFSSFKLDSIQEKRGQTHKASSELLAKFSSDKDDQYFPKYLTNQKLLDLQFSDSNFRRYILLQMLILAHYLLSNIKFKQEMMTEEQAQWVSKMGEKAVTLLAETPPNGTFFIDLVKHIFRRESKWNEWKNNGCPETKKPGTSMKAQKRPLTDSKEEENEAESKPPKKIRRKAGDLIRDADLRKKYTMGNLEMTRLWNICPNNLEACQQKNREFAPSLEAYFGTAIDQVLGKVETKSTEEKLVNDGNFGWRGLRLLANKSPHFFTHSANSITALPDYLTTMVKKLAKDLPSHNEEKPEEEEDEKDMEMLEQTAEKVEEEEEEEPDLRPQEETHPLKEEEIKALANNLAREGMEAWKKLATKIGFGDDEVEYFKEEKKSMSEGVILMFERWIENEKEDANKESLIYLLEGLKLKSVCEGVFT